MSAAPTAPSPLTSRETELINNYRKADQRGRESIAEHAQSTAEDWPSECPEQ